MFSNYKKYFLVRALICLLHFGGLSPSDSHSQESHEANVNCKRALADQFRDATGKSPCLSCSQRSDECNTSIEQEPAMNPFEIQRLDEERANSDGLQSCNHAEAARLAKIIDQWQQGVDSRPEPSGCCVIVANLYKLYCGCCCCHSCFDCNDSSL